MTTKRKAIQRLTVHQAIQQRDEARREALRAAGRAFEALRKVEAERDEWRRLAGRLQGELAAASGKEEA